MKRLVCIVEGHGECDAAPVLCARILRDLLGVHDWFVDDDPIRQPRGLIVSQKPVSRGHPSAELLRALQLAMIRAPNGILVLCDADDDCPATWGPAVPPLAHRGPLSAPVRGVMACREYESWLLWSLPAESRRAHKLDNPERSPRDAKKALGKLLGAYAPSTHQRAQTRACDLRAIWAGSASFHKLVRTLAGLSAAAIPPRPTP